MLKSACNKLLLLLLCGVSEIILNLLQCRYVNNGFKSRLDAVNDSLINDLIVNLDLHGAIVSGELKQNQGVSIINYVRVHAGSTFELTPLQAEPLQN